MSKKLADLERRLELARDLSVRTIAAMRSALIREGGIEIMVDALRLREQEGRAGKRARKR
jgi:hypothetical protein